MPETMRTIEIAEFGDADKLIAGTRPLPAIQQGEVLVKVACVGVNGPDLVQRRGHYPPPEGASDLLGLEVSGHIVAIDSAVSDWKPGDAVCALTNGGGYAEYVAIEATHCLPIPEGVELQDAAGLPETFFTIWSNCFHDQTHRQNALFLVHGGAGGIGSTAIQLGAAKGFRVFTTCSSEKDAEYCLSLGASQAINYRESDFVDVVRGAGGADLIIDIIGGDYIARNIKAASPDARIVQLAFNAGSRVELNLMPVMLKRLIYTGSTLRSRPDAFKSDIARSLAAEVWPLFKTGRLKTTTHTVLPFSRAREAHRIMESGEHRGKILMVPD